MNKEKKGSKEVLMKREKNNTEFKHILSRSNHQTPELPMASARAYVRIIAVNVRTSIQYCLKIGNKEKHITCHLTLLLNSGKLVGNVWFQRTRAMKEMKTAKDL